MILASMASLQYKLPFFCPQSHALGLDLAGVEGLIERLSVKEQIHAQCS